MRRNVSETTDTRVSQWQADGTRRVVKAARCFDELATTSNCRSRDKACDGNLEFNLFGKCTLAYPSALQEASYQHCEVAAGFYYLGVRIAPKRYYQGLGDPA